MKILELFSGYGTASFALKRLNIPYEIVGYSDIDKWANQCFQQNHGGKELGDVTKVDPNDLEDFDLLTGGFPCQAFSVAGKMGGETDPRGTLFYEIIRIAEVKKPKYMLLENVKGLTTKRFTATFEKILSELDRIGYKVYWKVLNSKDFGIPQSRARVWFVCFRKDIEHNFEWPQPVELKLFIKDILEPSVDEKYYLSPLLQERFKKYLEDKNRIVNLQPRQGKGIGGKGIISKNDGTTYCIDKTCGQGIVAMRSVQKDNLVYDRKGFDSRTKGFRESELSPTLSTKMGTGGNNVPMVTQGQLRRLTPKECFRLMGFLNDEINLEGLSDTQRYKLAGNGQDVNMVTKIFEQMFKRI